ncbi:hypothetical protein ANN_10234, partial [Periplaneta americana]
YSFILQLPELELLKEKCKDADPVISISACQGLVTLVEVGTLEVIPTLLSFIATVPTLRNYTGVIPSIGALLVIDLKVRSCEGRSYECPFSLYTPQHPLVTVLRQNKDAWIAVLSAMHFMCHHNEEIVAQNCLELLRPVFLYSLCDPSTTTCLSMACRQQMWELLLKASFRLGTRDLLLDILSWLQVETEVELLGASQMLLMLGDLALQHSDVVLCSALAPLLAALVHRLTRRGHDPRSCLSTLTCLLATCPEAGSCVLTLLSATVTSCPVIYLKDLIAFCVSLIDSRLCNVVAAHMLVCALLQWLMYPSYMTGEALQEASGVLARISDTSSWSSQTSRLCANKLLSRLRCTDNLVGSAVEMCRLAESWQSNPAVACEWLNRVGRDSPEHMQLFMSAVFVHGFDDPEVVQKSLTLLLCNSELAAVAVPLILRRLAEEKQPTLQLELLRGLMSTAAHKENVNLVLHTLESLRNVTGLRVVLVDLYVRLWRSECRCYPYLQRLLLENPTDVRDWKLDVARAHAVKEICETQPEQHGAELVKLLSQILNQCGGVEGSAASALALQGIMALCNAEIVNAATTWRALAPKLSRDKRSVVIISLCDFFGCILNMQCSGQEYDKLVAEVITKLWSYVSMSKEQEVVSAAFRALAKADLEKLSLKTLPECYRQRLQLPAAYAKTPVDAARRPEDVLTYIPCECWIQVLQGVPTEMLDAAGDTLGEWLSVELTLYLSSIYRTAAARGEPGSYSYLHHRSICRGLVEYLHRASQGTLEPPKVPVIRQCLRILGRTFPRPLPPHNWSFLQEFLQEATLTKHCLSILAKQASTSPSSRKIMENFLGTLQSSTENLETAKHLFENLSDLCRGIPPNSLKPFLEASFNLAIETSENEEGGALLTELFSRVKATLKCDDIHDANRTMLSILMEGLLDRFPAEHKMFDAYADCVTELSSKYLERMSSPSVWWEVTPDKLRQALGIRSALARKADTEIPLVWLNECIDATLNLTGEHTSVLHIIVEVLSCVRKHDSNCRWTMELLGQIENVLNRPGDTDNQQALMFLYDIFVLTVVVVSGQDCFAPSLESITASRENRLQLFPQALVRLLIREPWRAVASQVMEWLYHMQSLPAVSPLYADAFRRSLMALRHDKYFKILSVWMRFISCKFKSQ